MPDCDCRCCQASVSFLHHETALAAGVPDGALSSTCDTLVHVAMLLSEPLPVILALYELHREPISIYMTVHALVLLSA